MYKPIVAEKNVVINRPSPFCSVTTGQPKTVKPIISGEYTGEYEPSLPCAVVEYDYRFVGERMYCTGGGSHG